MKLIQFISEHLIVFCCLACALFVIIIHNKQTDSTKRYDVKSDASKPEMTRRLKRSMEEKSGGNADVTTQGKLTKVENNDFYAELTKRKKK